MKLGLTGSIGMGKSTVTKMFADLGVKIWDADLAVKALYESDEELYELVKSRAPKAAKNPIDRVELRMAIADDESILTALEAYIHPKIAEDRRLFLKETAGVLLCDIPLLFENKLEDEFDFTITVSAPYEVQLQRIMERGTMTTEMLEKILARQMSDEEKSSRADFVINTYCSLEETRAQVQMILTKIGVIDA